MRQDQNNEDSSSHSTDSEQNGNTASESSSSLGDSATAAARVLAAWQDRTGTPGSTSAAAAMAAAAAISGPASEGGVPSGSWPHAMHLTAEDKLQSSMSTPHVGHGSFGYHGREGSAPVPGVSDANQRRRGMGYLALLNSAVAYVAESSDTASGPDSQNQAQQQQQRQQHQDIGNSYMADGDFLNNPSLGLSGINSQFNRVGAGSDDGNGGFNSHYSDQLTNSDFHKLAQALRHIAATTPGTGSGILSSAVNDAQAQMPHYGTHQGYSAAAAAAAVTAAAAAGSIHSDHMMADRNLYAYDPVVGPYGVQHDQGIEMGDHPLTSPAGRRASTGGGKRKRADGMGQTPTKRKSSHASDQSTKGTPIPDNRRAARKWTEEETENLLRGCSKYGVGAWKKILDDSAFKFNNRTSVDLKDRFRTIRAQECAHSPASKNKGKGGAKGNAKEPDVVWPLPPNSQRLQGLRRVQRKPTRNYTNDEDRRLLIGVMRHANHWTKIAADTDLQLNDRPGQSLRDRLRNAFPEVFELFGYVIPKKERADRERHMSPDLQLAEEPKVEETKPDATPKRKAPTGSKRLEGKIPEHIKNKILEVLQRMNASLDPRPIPESDDETGSSYDADGDADADGDVQMGHGDDMHASAASSSVRKQQHSRKNRRLSTAGTAAMTNSNASSIGGGALNDKEDEPLALSAGVRSGGSKKTPAKRSRAKSKSGAAPARRRNTQEHSQQLDVISTGVGANDGGIHSAPSHARGIGGNGSNNQFVGLADYNGGDQHRSGTISAGPFGPQRNFLFDSFAPSVFSRPIGAMTPTDQLDALALEGRAMSGYSTPSQSTKRRHSVQADFNDVMAAAADAAGIDRANFSSAFPFFNTGVGSDMSNSAVGTNGGAMQLGSADTFRRMTIGGAMNPDAYLFPRLPEEEVAAAAAAAVAATVAAADISAQISSNQSAVGTPTMDGSNVHGVTGSESAGISVSVANNIDYKVSAMASPAVDSNIPTSAPLTSSVSVTDLRAGDYQGTATGQRGLLRSAQRLLRANGVADDNSIGLSTNPSTNDSRLDFDALSQLSQWFPNFAPNNLGWNIGDTGGHVSGESIDPNMLDAGLATAAMTAGAVGPGPAAPTGESNVMHARRRSQFDWYGLTPSLLAHLESATEAGNATAAAVAQAASSDTNAAIASLSSFGLGSGPVSQSYRRPSMPIYPTFAFQPSSMLGMQTQDHQHSSSQMIGEDSQGATATASGMVPMGLGDVSNHTIGAIAGASGFSTSSASSQRGLVNNATTPVFGPMLSAGSTAQRVSSGQGRRRTMHVPPSLLEDVATSEFTDEEALTVSSSSKSLLSKQNSRYNGRPYPPRPIVTSAAVRVHRSRTIGGNQNAIQAVVAQPVPGNDNGGVSHQTHHSAASTSAFPSASEATSMPPIQFPQLTAEHEANLQASSHRQSVAMGALDITGVAAHPSTRHTRTLSGTQLSQDAMNSLIGIHNGLMHVTAPGNGADAASSMDVDFDAMAAMGATGEPAASIDLSSFKPSLWTSSAAFADSASQLGTHDETRSLTDVRSVGGSRDASGLIDLYRPASSTPTGFSSRSGFLLSPAAVTATSDGGSMPMRNPSPILGQQLHTPTSGMSPVAPRSAASTPGRREAVGI
ncbi:hypothetical protein GGI15_002020 [Coemansia interrupta]|uniref:Uncharacterized protein n=1 Tax=Coemansia interrupta TaxID=1126814 RepID=A0A9W8LK90_9FUNG|nr:hypothetical protein GGI15_002020 [Coemansia interrupta]